MTKEPKQKNGTLNFEDPETASGRKKDHIDLALESQLKIDEIDQRFYYEPALSEHPQSTDHLSIRFLNKQMKAPLWICSMTGGTKEAGHINKNLARACRDFGLGMGLGSCRQLLLDNKDFDDFNLRDIIGEDRPFYANLGICQVEQIFRESENHLISNLVNDLKADGLVIHINPLQEWLQQEGDRLLSRPIETITRAISEFDFPIIVKEVGQGMGPKSLLALMRLPLQALEFGAGGGTNFSKLEIKRNHDLDYTDYNSFERIGHSAEEMVNFTNRILLDYKADVQCKELIISGGLQDFLDGYYLMEKSQMQSIYGQASGFLSHARGDYEELYNFVEKQIQGLAFAHRFLKIRPE